MSLLLWTPRIQVNIEEIDDQHKKLFELANIFYNKLYTSSPDVEILESINELTIFSINHFKIEEKLLAKYNIPNSDKHKKEHSDFINELAKLNSKIIKNDLLISVDLIDFLRNSIINHIFTIDREMACYIITQDNK
jgi:hemerythrin-like metal-binding protein